MFSNKEVLWFITINLRENTSCRWFPFEVCQIIISCTVFLNNIIKDRVGSEYHVMGVESRVKSPNFKIKESTFENDNKS